eukprot:TRINITY_DN92014_c0_g1_i1.p1 TRINITY_DN92014_c0_g1~~TRINITY_DN92014_c0_g1_i1.p1  ORF type:complete len:137 (+),score=14.36 TRINITY_DN92014_c0_g1_i1:63-473(+)
MEVETFSETENFLLVPTAQSATHQSSSIQLGHWYQSNMPTMQKCSGNSGPHLHDSLLLLPIGLDFATRLLREASTMGIVICWYLWKSRNNYIFEYIPVHPLSIIHKAAHHLLERHLSHLYAGLGSTIPRLVDPSHS